jgi:TetR/AcrR family transcriptional repressor of nem operon
MGRQRAYDSNTVVDQAMRAFWARGYEATSISDLVEATGINRASLYAGFDDKRGLFMASLRRYDERQRRGFLDRLAQDMAPRAAILAAFDAARTAPDAGQPGGCLLVNTALEVSPHDAEIRDFVQEALAGVELFFRDRIRAAQATGTTPRPRRRPFWGCFWGCGFSCARVPPPMPPRRRSHLRPGCCSTENFLGQME